VRSGRSRIAQSPESVARSRSLENVKRYRLVFLSHIPEMFCLSLHFFSLSFFVIFNRERERERERETDSQVATATLDARGASLLIGGADTANVKRRVALNVPAALMSERNASGEGPAGLPGATPHGIGPAAAAARMRLLTISLPLQPSLYGRRHCYFPLCSFVGRLVCTVLFISFFLNVFVPKFIVVHLEYSSL